MCLVVGTAAAGEFDERAATLALETEKAAHGLVILGSWDEAERVLPSALVITEVLESNAATAVLQARLARRLGADAQAGEACASAQEIAVALAMPRLMDAASDCRRRDEL